MNKVTNVLLGRSVVGLVSLVISALVFPMVAFGSGSLVQDSYQWRNDDGSEASASQKAAVNTAIIGVARGQNVRLRFNVTEIANYPLSISSTLQYATSEDGPWLNVGTDDSSAFKMTATSRYNTDDPTTKLIGSGTFSPGKCVEGPEVVFSNVTVNSLNHSNFEYCFQATAKASGSTAYYFQMTGLSQWTQRAKLTMASGEANETPVILSPLTAEASVTAPFTYTIQTSGSEPIANNVTGLPAGLTFDGLNTISGQAADPGTYNVIITATNAYGLDPETLVLSVLSNIAPVADDQNSYSIIQGGEVPITLSWSDVDTPLLSDHTFSIVSPSTNGGTLESYNQRYNSTAHPNIWYYRASSTYLGEDTFTWKCNDGDKDSNIATCTVTVNGNTPPVASSTDGTVASGSRGSCVFTVADPDAGQTVTYMLVSPPSAGGVVELPAPRVVGSSLAVYYTPPPGFAGNEVFTWRCNDGADDSNISTVTMTVTPGAPVPMDQMAVVIKDTTTDIPVSYAGGGGYSYTLMKSGLNYPAHGSVTISGTTFTYTPDTDYVGTDQIAWYMTYDGTDTEIVTCSITVMPDTGSDWPMWRMDEHRSGMTTHVLPDNLNLQWTWSLPVTDKGFGTYEFGHEPVVLGSRMFVPSSRNDMLLAINTGTGAEEWRFYAEGPIRTAPAACRLPSGDERVYVASDDGHLYCLDATDGTLVWKKRGGPSTRKMIGFDRLISTWPCMTSPFIMDGKVHFTAGLISSERGCCLDE